tara:strand:+ start:577 stop:2391 length:1815 start_codon:yes stop_codon:yes gene_type:complete
MILTDYKRGTFSLMNFWSRRITRILPALIFMIGCVITLSFFFIYKNEHIRIGNEALSSLFSIANIYLWTLTRNYWGPQPEHSFFLHTWSLSLEEQFYFIFPLVILFLIAKAPHLLLKFSLTITCVGFLLFSLFATDHPQASFYLLPARCWEIAMGTTLAILNDKRSDTLRGVSNSIISLLSWLGFFLIIIGYVFLDGTNGIGYGLIFPTAGTAIFLFFSINSNIGAAKILSLKPFVQIGKISYSLYLWHWPVLLFSKNSEFLSTNLALIIILLISIFSYYFIELNTRKNQRTIPIIVVCFIFCSYGAFYLKQNKEFYDTSSFEKTTWNGHQYDISPIQEEWDDAMKLRMHGIKIVERTEDEILALKKKGDIMDDTNAKKPKLLVMGNSHALMWSGIIDEIANELGISVSFYGMDSKFPFIRNFSSHSLKNESGTFKYDNDRVHAIAKGDCTVIFAVRWSWSWRHYQEARKMISFIEKQGSSTILIEQPPELFFGDKNAPQYISFLGYKPTENGSFFIKQGNVDQYEKGRMVIRELEKEFNSCSIIRTKDLFIDNDKKEKVRVTDGKRILYIDDDHLSLEGSRIPKERIKNAIERSLSLNSLNLH